VFLFSVQLLFQTFLFLKRNKRVWLTLNSLERIEELCIILFALAMQYDILPHLTWVHAPTMNPIWNYDVCWHAFSQSASVRMLYR
jgi:hypothetical protein